jgi:hypothetical protein
MPSEHFELSRKLELERIISLQEAADLRGCSVDSIKRNHGDKIIAISPRRRGMRLRHALMLTDEAA